MASCKEWALVFFVMLLAPLLSACDLFGEGDDFVDYPETATFVARQPTLLAERTQTAAPLRTLTAQVQRTLTALPVNETATGAAMGATETSAASATQQLFTREAQTVAANLTATQIAQARGTNTPTHTATTLPPPTATSTQPPSPTQVVTFTPISATILTTVVDLLPLDQMFAGQPLRRAANNVTDPSIVYDPARVDFLKQNNANTLINNWQTSDTSFTFVGNRFPTNNLVTQWQGLSLQNAPATAANDQVFTLASDSSAARLDSVLCKTGERTINGRQFNTGYCDIFNRNVHFGFNFLTTREIQAVMNTNAPLILKTLADNLE